MYRTCYNCYHIALCITYIIDKKRIRENECKSVMSIKERKEKLVELSKKTEQKSLTQYVLDRCIVEDVDTNVDGSTHSSIRVEKMLQRSN